MTTPAVVVPPDPEVRLVPHLRRLDPGHLGAVQHPMSGATARPRQDVVRRRAFVLKQAQVGALPMQAVVGGGIAGEHRPQLSAKGGESAVARVPHAEQTVVWVAVNRHGTPQAADLGTFPGRFRLEHGHRELFHRV